MKRISKLLLLMVCIAMFIPAYSVSAQESQLRSVHIYRALWQGDPAIIKAIQGISFDFIVTTRERINGEDMVFIDKAGKNFVLRADGYPDVAATIIGGFGDNADAGFEFQVNDLSQMVKGVHYQLVPPSISSEYTWEVESGVTVNNSVSGSSTTQPSNGGNPLDYGSELDPEPDKQARSPFSDVADNYWALTAIKDLADRGVIGGYPDGKFRPNKVVTRAEFAKIMMLASGAKAKKVTKSTFADLQPTDWETPFVEASKTYLNGYKLTNGKLIFKPDSPAIREDIAVALVKLKGYDKTHLPDQSMLQAMFKDFTGISKYARNYVAIAVESGIASGFPDETFRPQQPVTRAQAASMLWRAYQYGDDNKSDDTEEIVELGDSDADAGANGNEAGEQPADDGQGYSVTVKVTDVDGNAVNTGLYLRGASKDYPTARNNGDAGIYSFAGIPNGKYEIKFHYAGYVLQTPGTITVNGGNVKQIVLHLAVPTFTVTGKAIDAEGNPIAGARISLVTDSNTGGYWPATDASGGFKLNDIAPGTYTIVVGDTNNPKATAELEVTDGNVAGIVIQGD
ncbi:S-layer homology domain-containing protein [Paenibacillus albus]|uniref:SLH domain-containing protein n=1 Tax=Paenibacillus albus TaxID=2495582 RepID=A0A3Q8XAE3_9BACL|nr:S-layer homology domain-containing protein [Paenibacillus albus]AZN43255.1 hypothetical protein EJC50_28875 [Paenibacillus albus]